jgi:hypothetical protein
MMPFLRRHSPATFLRKEISVSADDLKVFRIPHNKLFLRIFRIVVKLIYVKCLAVPPPHA